MARTKAPAASPAGSKTTEGLIRELEATKAALNARVPALEAAKAAAVEKRRELLISGGDATAAARDAREAEDDLAAVADALIELDRQIDAANAQRDAEDERAKRDAVAAGLVSDAEAISKFAGKMHGLIMGLRQTVGEIEFGLSGRGSANVNPHDQYVRSPREIAEGLLSEALADCFPFLDIRDRFGMRVEGRSASELGAAHAANLRVISGDLHAGNLAAAVREYVETEPHFTARRPERHVWVTDPFFYQTDRGRQMVHPGGQGLNVALAEFALEHDLAAEAKPAHWGDRKAGNTRGPTIDEYVSTPFNLSDWERADVAEQLAAWHSEREAERARVAKTED